MELPSRASKVNAEEAEQAYRAGFQLRVIAERYGVSKELIRLILLSRGVPMRKRGGNTGIHSRHRK
jgi:Zn-dependent peptidase ImmA (M78 family)